MTETTALDLAHAAMDAAPEDDAARLRFYHRLADSELFLLLSAEPDGEDIAPQVFRLEEGAFVAVFDREERLAAFCDAPAPYAALPGRVIAAQLAGQGVGLALNLAVAPSAYLLPAGAVDWLARTLRQGPGRAEAGQAPRPESFAAPNDAPPELSDELAAKLRGFAAFAKGQQVGRSWRRVAEPSLVFWAPHLAEPALAKAVAEALAFSGVDAALDVAFPPADDPAADAVKRVARMFDLSGSTPADAPRQGPSRPSPCPQSAATDSGILDRRIRRAHRDLRARP